jgi:hypothetical protein
LIKSRRMRWLSLLVYTGEKSYSYKVSVGKCQGGRRGGEGAHLEDIDVHGQILLKLGMK